MKNLTEILIIKTNHKNFIYNFCLYANDFAMKNNYHEILKLF